MRAIERRNNHLVTIPWLLAHGADVCLRNNSNHTAYDRALPDFRTPEELALLPLLICNDNGN
jgi:hypothetical protein